MVDYRSVCYRCYQAVVDTHSGSHSGSHSQDDAKEHCVHFPLLLVYPVSMMLLVCECLDGYIYIYCVLH